MVRPHATFCAVALALLTGAGLEPSVAKAQQDDQPGGPACSQPGPRRRWQTISSRTTPGRERPATFDTDVRMMYDDDALYFGVFARDDEPGRIIINALKKDYNTDGSDGFRIILDSFHDERNGYQFATNPAGAKRDAQTSNLRFNIIHRPLSDFFLVYNERRDERTGDMLSRAVIAKMTYLVAF